MQSLAAMERCLGSGFNVCWRTCVLVGVLLLWSVPAALTQSDFLNIDCGATSSYVDSATSLSWEPDAPYISSGKTQAVTLPTSLQNFTEMQTLRFFDDARAKNCYALPVVNSSGTYLLQLSFYYGDYDNTNLPPNFQVGIDANIISNVTLDANGVSHQEYHYMPLGNITYVCLIRTSPGATPFISGISLKEASELVTGYPKEFATFLQQKIIMKTRNRLNFGGTAPIRAPADYYDRLWFPSTDYYLTPTVAGSFQFLNTTTPIQDLVGSNSFPPSAVMQSAVASLGLKTLESFLMPEGSPAIDSTSVYMSFYFAELNSSASRLPLRNFTLHPNLFNMVTSDIDMSGYKFLDYLRWDFWQEDVNLGNGSTVLLTPVVSAKAGPILNCMEIFARSEARIAMTADRDALAIEDIKEGYNLTEWTGDPCLPVPHAWITCNIRDPTSNASEPMITAVNLSGYQLVGKLQANFASLQDLMSLDLSNNSLSGLLPEWLTTMAALRVLAVQNNNFSGPIPEGLLSPNSQILFMHDGNPFLGNQSAPGPANTTGKSNTAIIAGVATTGGVVVIIVVTILVFCQWKHKHKPSEEEEPMAPTRIVTLGGAKAYSYAEVAIATNQFDKSRKLGEGGFGFVYYGKLLDGQEVAIKVAKGNSELEERAFFTEVDVLSQVHHTNLVALVGYCQEQKQILIYEYMHNGSLFDHLHGNLVHASTLNWRMRLNIALNAAQGLEYLHTKCKPSFIHRDVKSRNILLTHEFEAKVADFGVTKPLSAIDGTRVMTNNVMGTPGYLDPEYNAPNNAIHSISSKIDVYSFGIVLLELITGNLPTNRRNEHISNWVQERLHDITSILDPAVIASNPNMEAIQKVVKVAMQCVKPESAYRPTMNEVVQELQGTLAIEMPSTQASNLTSSHSSQSSGLSNQSSTLYRSTGIELQCAR